MFGLQKWQLYAIAAVAGYFIYKNYFGGIAAAQTALPAPSPVQENNATLVAFPPSQF